MAQKGNAAAIRQQASPIGLSEMCIYGAISSAGIAPGCDTRAKNPRWFDSTAPPATHAIQEGTVLAKGSTPVNGTFWLDLPVFAVWRLGQQLFHDLRHSRESRAQLCLILAASLGNLRLASA